LPCLFNKNIISPATSLKDTFFFTDHMRRNNVNVLITVPSNINRIQNYNKNQKNLNVKKVIMCGETFYSDILNYLIETYPKSDLYNCYGSTELSPWVFSYKYNKKNNNLIQKKGIVPIGKNFSNVNYFFNNKNELNIKGPMVVSGYSNKILNKSKFFKTKKQWTYNTSDIAEKKQNLIFIKGRSDTVEKINGYRIEMLEIETKLRTSELVKNCFAFVQYIDDYEKILIAAIELNNKISKKKHLNENIKNFLRQKLPHYMIPKKFVFFNKFPINKNGKLDKVKIRSNII
jgi:D-alanine--poly(phosphoribitol) ligase subunit 1